jgi:hypothetical protein
MDGLLFVLAIFVIILVYLPFGNLLYKQNRLKSARLKFFKAANSILQRNSDDQAAVGEFLLAYKKTVQFQQNKSMPYKSAADFLEELIFKFDTLEVDAFKATYGFIKSEEMRRRAGNILSIMKQMQPYAAVSSKFAGLLDTLNKALHGGDAELGILSLNQLTKQISTLESAHQYQLQVNLVAVVTSVLGLVLAVMFAITLIVK